MKKKSSATGANKSRNASGHVEKGRGDKTSVRRDTGCKRDTRTHHPSGKIRESNSYGSNAAPPLARRRQATRRGSGALRVSEAFVQRGTDFERLDPMTDVDIARQVLEDVSVAPEFTDEMVAQARWVAPKKKVPISFRVDPDVLKFFKAEGEGYQSRMNAVLRAYMDRRRHRGTN
jgi:uncharacterized protein (DUF4415 family)